MRIASPDARIGKAWENVRAMPPYNLEASFEWGSTEEGRFGCDLRWRIRWEKYGYRKVKVLHGRGGKWWERKDGCQTRTRRTTSFCMLCVFCTLIERAAENRL